MSDPSSVDLSDLNFMPEWLKGSSGKSGAPREDSNDRPPARKGGGKGHNKGGGGGRGGGRRDDFQGRGRDGGGRDGGKGGGQRNRNDRDRRDSFERRPAPTPPPKGVLATLQPAKSAVHQIAEQIKKTARAYPVFDVARLMLAAQDRFCIVFKRDGADAPELFSCGTDGSAWLSRAEAIAHLPETPAFAEHYDEETVEGDPPKGNYTSIAVCGMSGALIGPPNHHSYQTEIARLHREHFANMPLERYKSRIRIERDEEVVDKWKTEQSVQHHFIYKLAPEGEEAPKFESRDAASKHFIEKHAEGMVAPASEVTVPGNIAGKCLSPGLLALHREASQNAHRHPATLVQPLCRMLGAENLKFFKRGRKIFAALTRPKPLNDKNGLSAPILAIVEFLRAHKRANVDTLLAALAPAPSPPTTAEADPGATAETEATPVPETEAKTELTAEQIKVLQDLRWLLHEGAVIAFGDGHIELATPKAQPNKSKKSPPAAKAAKTPPEATPEANPAATSAPQKADEAPAKPEASTGE